MPAMFLPHDSVHVSICSYHVETHCSVSVEGYLWKWIPHVMTVHYPIDPMEDIDVAGQLSDFNRNGVGSEYDDDWRALGRCEAASNFYFFVLHSLQVHVRTPRLIGLIHFGMINSIG